MIDSSSLQMRVEIGVDVVDGVDGVGRVDGGACVGCVSVGYGLVGAAEVVSGRLR